MTERTYLGDPQRTSQAGKDITSAGDRLSGAVKRHGDRIRGITGSKPWGGDDTGRNFEKGYVKAEETFFPAAEQIGELVTGVGNGIQQAVKLLGTTDEGNADRFKKA